MPASLARKAMTTISRVYCAPVLKPLGFNHELPHFWRAPPKGLLQCINFQESAWGDSDSGRFTINLGVSSPALTLAVSRRAGKPGTDLWPIQARIGMLMPEGHDVWWDVYRSTDVAMLGDKIAKILVAYAVPFLEHYGTARLLEDHSPRPYGKLQIGVGPLGPARAVLAVKLGDKDKAANILRAELVDANDGYADIIRRLAKELRIDLEPID